MLRSHLDDSELEGCDNGKSSNLTSLLIIN